MSETTPSRILVTAGPTHEPIDAVRFIGNRSSGRMGIALAEEAARRGHPTTLLLGPQTFEPPVDSHLRCVRFRTTEDLEHALTAHWSEHDVLIMAAAVADFRPTRPPGKAKLPRDAGRLVLELEATPDLVARMAASRRSDQRIIGFALEPEVGLLEAAAAKLRRKGLDAVVANPLATMDAPTVTATLVLADGRTLTPPPDISKTEFAAWLLDRLTDGSIAER